MNNKRRRGEKATAFNGSSNAIMDDPYHRRHRIYTEGVVEQSLKGATVRATLPAR